MFLLPTKYCLDVHGAHVYYVDSSIPYNNSHCGPFVSQYAGSTFRPAFLAFNWVNKPSIAPMVIALSFTSIGPLWADRILDVEFNHDILLPCFLEARANHRPGNTPSHWQCGTSLMQAVLYNSAIQGLPASYHYSYTRFTYRTHLYLPWLLPRRSPLARLRPGCWLNHPRMPRFTWFRATTGWQPM